MPILKATSQRTLIPGFNINTTSRLCSGRESHTHVPARTHLPSDLGTWNSILSNFKALSISDYWMPPQSSIPSCSPHGLLGLSVACSRDLAEPLPRHARCQGTHSLPSLPTDPVTMKCFRHIQQLFSPLPTTPNTRHQTFPGASGHPLPVPLHHST